MLDSIKYWHLLSWIEILLAARFNTANTAVIGGSSRFSRDCFVAPGNESWSAVEDFPSFRRIDFNEDSDLEMSWPCCPSEATSLAETSAERDANAEWLLNDVSP